MDRAEYLSKVQEAGKRVLYGTVRFGIWHSTLEAMIRTADRIKFKGILYPIDVYVTDDAIVEIAGYEPDSHELITNTVFRDKNVFTGHSFLLERKE